MRGCLCWYHDQEAAKDMRTSGQGSENAVEAEQCSLAMVVSSRGLELAVLEVLAAAEVTVTLLLVDLLWKRFFRVIASVVEV